MQHISHMHSKFALRPQRAWNGGSMVDIQSPTAENRRGKKEEQPQNIMPTFTTQAATIMIATAILLTVVRKGLVGKY